MWLDFLKFAGPTFFPLWKSELQGIHGPRIIALTYKPALESEASPHPLEYTRRQVGPLRIEQISLISWKWNGDGRRAPKQFGMEPYGT